MWSSPMSPFAFASRNSAPCRSKGLPVDTKVHPELPKALRLDSDGRSLLSTERGEAAMT